MASILRVPVVWNGLSGLPGVTVLFWDGGVSSVVTDITDFFDDISDYFPSALSWTIPSSGDSLSDSTGAIDGFWSTTGGGTVNGTGGGGAAFPNGVGVRVRWRTGGLRNGRRVVGSTFLTSMLGSAFDTNGTIGSAALGAVQASADLLVASGALLVWSRPTPGGSDGFSSAVTSAEVPDRVTSLRSRRY